MSDLIIVGSRSFSVGEWNEQFLDAIAEVGATKSSSAAAKAKRRLATLNAAIKKAAAQAKNNKLKALAATATKTTNATLAAQNAAAAARLKATRDFLDQPTCPIPVCFDAVAPGSVSAVATISSPHDQPWRMVAIVANDSQCDGMRVTSLKFGNTEHVPACVAYVGGTPTQPGVDLSIFSGKLHRAILPSHQFRPWGLGRGGWIRPDGKIYLQLFNPSATAKSANLIVLVQSSPCGEKATYGKDFMYEDGSQVARSSWSKLRRGAFSFVPRAIAR
ncbi:hypothetical protein [Chondromyces apiculatus]|nr:hypothetical protein [Chondromyces apiculatus]